MNQPLAVFLVLPPNAGVLGLAQGVDPVALLALLSLVPLPPQMSINLDPILRLSLVFIVPFTLAPSLSLGVSCLVIFPTQ